jgi:hypothetical protein
VCSLHIIVDTPGFIGVGTQIGNRDRWTQLTRNGE